MKVTDTRDLVERLEELNDKKSNIEDLEGQLKEKEADLEDLVGEDLEAAEEELEELKEELEDAQDDFGDGEKEELEELEELESEIPDFRHGETMVPVEDFEDYCQELCEDIGDLPRDLPGYIVIDWEATADNLKADYTTVTYLGDEYYVRSC